MKSKNIIPALLLLTATSCYPVATNPKIAKLPPVQERKVETRCCLVQKDGQWMEIDEKTAKSLYSDNLRYYFMDGESWGNLQKVAAERRGRIREYEQFPCIGK